MLFVLKYCLYLFKANKMTKETNAPLYNSYLKFRKAAVLPYLTKGRDYEINNFSYDMVTQYLIKGVWYFDRVFTELKFRPIAIGPIALSAEDKFEQTKLL